MHSKSIQVFFPCSLKKTSAYKHQETEYIYTITM